MVCIFQPFRRQPPIVVQEFWSGFHILAYRRSFHRSGAPRPLGNRASLGFRHWGVGSPRRQAEIAFVNLRTSRSPPVAFHLASRQRSYVRLRGSDQPRRGLAPRGYRPLASAHPCRLARQVKEFLSYLSRRTSSPAGQAGRGRYHPKNWCCPIESIQNHAMSIQNGDTSRRRPDRAIGSGSSLTKPTWFAVLPTLAKTRSATASLSSPLSTTLPS
jgi:hypothetical protein